MLPPRVSEMVLTGGEDNLGKMAKSCMKITKLVFLGQNSGDRHEGDKPTFQVVGDPPQSPPLGGHILNTCGKRYIGSNSLNNPQNSPV